MNLEFITDVSIFGQNAELCVTDDGKYFEIDTIPCGGNICITVNNGTKIPNHKNEEKMGRLYTKEWCNTGMPNELTWIYTTDKTDGKLKDAIGDIFAVNHDATLGFRCHVDNDYSVVNVLNSTLYFYDQEELECDDNGELLNAFVYLDHKTLAHIFMIHINDLYNHGRCDCDLFLDQMRQFSEDNNLNLVFKEEYCREEYENTWICYTAEFAHKAHFDEDAVFAFSVDSAKELESEGYHSNYEFEEVYMLYPDGCVDKDMAIVCYKKGGEE